MLKRVLSIGLVLTFIIFGLSFAQSLKPKEETIGISPTNTDQEIKEEAIETSPTNTSQEIKDEAIEISPEIISEETNEEVTGEINEGVSDVAIKGTIKEIAPDASYIVVDGKKIITNKEFLDYSNLQVGDKVEIFVEETEQGPKAIDYNYTFEEEPDYSKPQEGISD